MNGINDLGDMVAGFTVYAILLFVVVYLALGL